MGRRANMRRDTVKMEVMGFTFVGEHKRKRGQVSVISSSLVKVNLILRLIH